MLSQLLKSLTKNKSINFFNLHYTIQSFANSLVNLFIGIFLYQAGVPLWIIFLAIAGMHTLRAILRPLSLKLCLKFRLNNILILGTFLFVLNFPVLGQIHGINTWFYIFFVLRALTEVIYWLPYHTMYALLGDNKHRGSQTGFRDGIIKISGFLAPIVSGLLILFYGYWGTFLAASILMLIALLPLYRMPKTNLKKSYLKNHLKDSDKLKGFWLYVGDGFFQMHQFTWKIILFLLILNPAYFGGLIGLVVLIQFVLMLLAGNLFDNGKGKGTSRFGTIIIMLAILGRGLYAYSIPQIIFFDVIFAIGATLYSPIFESVFYNIAKSSKKPLRYLYYSEYGWDLGTVLAALLSALIVYSSNNLRLAMVISITGLFITNYIMQKYFGKDKGLT